MRSAVWILLASLTVCNLTLILGQNIPEEGDVEEQVPLDEILQRAENIIIRSILKKMEDEDTVNDQVSSQPEWLSKRQHPGKRYQEDVEKRQHPGKREEEEEDLGYADLQKRQHPGRREEDEGYLEPQKRQHPGKREDETDAYVELQRRQHPGKRSSVDPYPDALSSPTGYASDMSKRQHPGKRYLMYNKRQHPGRRELDDELDSGDLQDLEKRQHPGKRNWEIKSPDYGTNAPCDIQDPVGCSKASLLLELLENVNQSRAEEKRQHPGRRVAFDEELTEQE
ncbi:pro-thyrotropin-releasing hormone [Amia ocellicauda]|uniref:pro-thyrotropin-releasing hormone n=1 Tax=Amia ocellicauda TaxID=2972642 RepID=UPI00346426AB